MKRISILLLILSTCLLTTVSAWSASHTVHVPPPNGVDDTANIQTALDACVAYGPGCTVQLQAGHYFTKQLVEYNLHGTFKGMGKDATIIEALPYLFVNIEAIVPHSLCRPQPGNCFWGTVIVFVNGNIHVSDLSLIVPTTNGTTTLPWAFEGVTYVGLLDAMTFTGQSVTATVDRVHMEGRPDPTNPYFGYNVVNLLHYTGEFPRSSTPWDWYFVGSFTVRNSSFSNGFVGISQDGFVQASRVTIGGSPSAGNYVENGYGGIDIEASQNSFFEISHNHSSGTGAAAWVVPWQPEFVPNSPSLYLIHDNTFVATGQYADGFYLLDDATNPWIQAAVWNNKAEVQDTLSEGIGAYNTKGTLIWNNTVTGTDGFDAIGLYNATHGAVIGNNVGGFTVDSTAGNAQIYLDASTRRDLAVCADPSDTALNQGTNNVVIGCAAAEDSAILSHTPATSIARPNLPNKKPSHP